MSGSFTEDFIQHLKGIGKDRGKLSTLRKGLIENQSQATWPLLSRFMKFDSPYHIKTLQTVAGIFGHHPVTIETGNFGNICYKMLDEDEKQKMAKGESGPISRHFQFVMAADGEEIFPRIRRLLLRAKRDEIPVNYVQLTEDLLGWQSSYKRNKIKLSWGKSFWKTNHEAENGMNEMEVDKND